VGVGLGVGVVVGVDDCGVSESAESLLFLFIKWLFDMGTK